jgi:ubiquinone/menaquinone biosynthesis C-methylase UbiE
MNNASDRPNKSRLYRDPGHDVCPVWIAHTFDNPVRRWFHNPERMFADYVRPGMRVLDLGCGLGYFSLGLARMVGVEGHVLSLDLQDGMLMGVRARAKRHGLSERIETVRCTPDALGVKPGIDFALMFWMLHETPDHLRALQMMYEVLKPGGVLFIAEPGIHVGKGEFERLLGLVRKAGFEMVAQPRVRLSRTMVLKKKE